MRDGKFGITDGDKLCKAIDSMLRCAVLACIRESELGCVRGNNNHLAFSFQQFRDSRARIEGVSGARQPVYEALSLNEVKRATNIDLENFPPSLRILRCES